MIKVLSTFEQKLQKDQHVFILSSMELSILHLNLVRKRPKAENTLSASTVGDTVFKNDSSKSCKA